MLARLVVIVCALAHICCSAVAQPSPIAVYEFDDGGAGVVTDSVGGNDGALFGQAAIADGGVLGGCLQLARGEGTYASLGDRFPFEGQDFSLSLWLRTPPDYAEAETFVLGRHVSGVAAGYILFVNTTGGAYGTDGAVSFYYSGGCITGTSAVTDGAWHHVAVVHPRDGACQLYVDGQLEAIGDPVPMVVVETSLVLGGIQVGETPVGSFPGAMDRLAIYDCALAPDDIAALAQR